MPRVKIDAGGVTVELDANEASINELGEKALDLFKRASEAESKRSPGLAFGLAQEKRWTPDHTNPNYNSNTGFRPVKARGEQGSHEQS